MDTHLAQVVGTRVRYHRAAAYKTKAVVAGLCGITPEYLYKIERGLKLPTLGVLAQLAQALGVDLADLVTTMPAPPKPRRLDDVAADAIYRALVAPPDASSVATQVDMVRTEIAEAWAGWQTSPHRYSTVAADLPELITTTRSALKHTDATQTRAAHRCAADLYCLLRSVTKRIGRADLSLMVVDRAVEAAHLAEDPVRIAGARWNLTQVLLADGQFEGAEDIALRAIDDLAPLRLRSDPDGVALSGALLLIAAIAAARNGDGWAARERVRQAGPLAEQIGERNTCWTAFGPTNVAMYAVSIEVESGDAVEGLRLANTIDEHRSPSIERRVAFLLDHARGLQQRREFARALPILEQAAREAPEDMRYRPTARTLINTTIERGGRSVSHRAQRLAGTIGLPL